MGGESNPSAGQPGAGESRANFAPNVGRRTFVRPPLNAHFYDQQADDVDDDDDVRLLLCAAWMETRAQHCAHLACQQERERKKFASRVSWQIECLLFVFLLLACSFVRSFVRSLVCSLARIVQEKSKWQKRTQASEQANKKKKKKKKGRNFKIALRYCKSILLAICEVQQQQ